MSFSSKVKDEVSRLDLKKMCCINAELLGIDIIDDKKSGSRWELYTESHSFARRLFSILKKLDIDDVLVEQKRNDRLRKNTYFIVSCNQSIKELIETRVYPVIDCCRRAFIRGIFLAGGSIISPDKSYHLELNVRNDKAVETIMDLIRSFGLKPKIITRKDNYLIYLKEGEDLVDFLNVIGAHKALLEIENVRILKDVRNSVNRIVNCETANLEKTINASFRQIEGIKLVQETIGIEALPDNLRQIALLRLEYRELNLKELGDMLEPRIGKSGVNHRLRKIDQIAERIRNKRGE